MRQASTAALVTNCVLAFVGVFALIVKTTLPRWGAAVILFGSMMAAYDLGVGFTYRAMTRGESDERK